MERTAGSLAALLLAAFNTMAEREGERMQKDQRFVAECMRGKGYSEK